MHRLCWYTDLASYSEPLQDIGSQLWLCAWRVDPRCIIDSHLCLAYHVRRGFLWYSQGQKNSNVDERFFCSYSQYSSVKCMIYHNRVVSRSQVFFYVDLKNAASCFSFMKIKVPNLNQLLVFNIISSWCLMCLASNNHMREYKMQFPAWNMFISIKNGHNW